MGNPRHGPPPGILERPQALTIRNPRVPRARQEAPEEQPGTAPAPWMRSPCRRLPRSGAQQARGGSMPLLRLRRRALLLPRSD